MDFTNQTKNLDTTKYANADEINKTATEIDGLRCQLAASRANEARLAKVLEKQLEELEQGFYTWSSEPNIIRCSECAQGSDKDCDAIIHEEYCNSGMIRGALASTNALNWLQKERKLAAADEVERLYQQIGEFIYGCERGLDTASQALTVLSNRAAQLEAEAAKLLEER
jgi:hypothetical protein